VEGGGKAYANAPLAQRNGILASRSIFAGKGTKRKEVEM